MMKLIHVFWFVLVLNVFLVGCRKQEPTPELPEIDLKKVVATERLKMSDILDNVRLIKLETREDVLLPAYFQSCIGNKYIVTLGRDESHLFTIEGKHIRKIAQQGRGPEEYMQMIGACVDEQEEYLHLFDGQDILKIDLNEGKVLQRFRLKELCSQLLLKGKDTLFYLPMFPGESHNVIGCTKTDGTFIKHFPGMTQKRSFAVTAPYLGKMNGNIHYKRGWCDTIFSIQDTSRIPLYRIVNDQPYTKNPEVYKCVDITFENKDLFILMVNRVSDKTIGNKESFSADFEGRYFFQKSDLKLKKMTDLYVDILDCTTKELASPFLISGKKVYIQMNVARFKELLKDKLESPLIADYLKKLYNELQEDDNPLLLIGDIK